MRVENYNLVATNGRHIRKATKVIYDDGKEIRFVEKVSKKEAIRNAIYQRDKVEV